MDPFQSFTSRLQTAMPLMAVWFAAGLAIAVWDPQPKLILTATISVSTGMLLLGPYAAAALYGLRLQGGWRSRLRWPLCLVLVSSTVLLLDLALRWTRAQLLAAGATALVGTILGHDATLAVLELRGAPRLDRLMVVLFPLLAGLSVLAGYSSFGFGAGSVQLVAALLRRP